MFLGHIQGGWGGAGKAVESGTGSEFFLTFREGIQRILGHFY